MTAEAKERAGLAFLRMARRGVSEATMRSRVQQFTGAYTQDEDWTYCHAYIDALVDAGLVEATVGRVA